MLSYLDQLVKKYKDDLFIAIVIVLVALISFGAGWLLASHPHESQIIFNESPSILSVSALNDADEEIVNNNQEGIFVGSINSNKYHWPDCQWAKRISIENQIWFNSEKEAQKAGYIRCGNFEKYIPD